MLAPQAKEGGEERDLTKVRLKIDILVCVNDKSASCNINIIIVIYRCCMLVESPPPPPPSYRSRQPLHYKGEAY